MATVADNRAEIVDYVDLLITSGQIEEFAGREMNITILEEDVQEACLIDQDEWIEQDLSYFLFKLLEEKRVMATLKQITDIAFSTAADCGVKDVEFLHAYGSRFRPLSPMWVRVEGEYFKEWIILDGKLTDPRFHSVIVTVNPLTEEKIKSLELEKIE